MTAAMTQTPVPTASEAWHNNTNEAVGVEDYFHLLP